MPRLGQLTFAADAFRHTEVGDARLTLVVQKYVRRFQVAVNDFVVVCELNGLRDGLDQTGRVTSRKRPAGNSRRQALPLDVAHREIVLPFVLAHLLNRHDPRVIQIRCRLRFGVEPFHILLARQLTGQDHLQSDDPVQAGLPGAVDHAHRATGNFLQQLVVAEVTDSRARRWTNGLNHFERRSRFKPQRLLTRLW